METNAVNTQLTPEFLESLSKEERTDLLEYLTNYPFIRWMIDPNRPYAKDLERDSDGKIIVNVVKPHILENMNYFRKPALAYKKYGKYTNLRPNGNPNSPYMKWLRKEVLKCWYGCKRPSDGEWITGYHYFYLNYSPIERATTNIKDTNAVNRVVDFPDFYDGDYIFFHYINQARYGGMYNEYKGGNHSALIAARGKGKAISYSTIVYTPDGYKRWKDIHIGSKLYGDDGIPTIVKEIYEQGEIPIYKVTFKDNREAFVSEDHLWTVKYGKSLKTVNTKWILENGFGNRIVKGKVHYPIENKCFVPINKSILIEEKQVPMDPYILGLSLGDGCIRYSTSNGILFSSHPNDIIEYKTLTNRNIRDYKNNNWFIEYPNAKQTFKDLELFDKSTADKFVPDIYKYNSEHVRLEILKGLMDTDGSVYKNGIEFISKSKQLAEDVLWIARSLGIRGKITSKFVSYKGEKREYFRVKLITSKVIFKLSRKINKIQNRNTIFLKNQEEFVAITDIKYSHNEKAKCVVVDNDSHLFLMNDFIVTHNSFKVASMTTRNFVLGENIDVSEKVKSVIVASNTEYLKKDGTLNKVMAMTDFLALNTQFPSSRLKSSTQEMHWVMGYKDTKNKDVSLGTRNEVIGLSLNNDSDKARGKRSHLMVWEEFGMFPGFIDAWNTSRPNVEEGGYSFGQAIALGTGGCVCAGTKIFTNSGEIKNIEDLVKEEGIIGYNTKTKTHSKETISYIQPLQKKECLEITTSFGKSLRCSKDHPILVKDKFIEAKNLKLGDKIKIIEEIPLFGNYSPKYARVIGWMIGDGSYGKDQVARLSNCEPEILDFIKSNFKYSVQREHRTKLGKLYQEIAILGFCKFLREEGVYGQTKLKKTFPIKIGQYSKEALSELIGGFFDTDGYVYCRKAKGSDLAEISVSSASKQLLEMLSLLLIKFGIHGRMRERKPRENNPLDKNSYYEYTIADSVSLLNFCNSIKLYPKVKQERLDKIKEIFSKKLPTSKREEKIISIEDIGLQTIYNLTADNTHTYVANGIVTHNTEGSDFSGALEMIYNPLGYNVYGVPNVFDKGTSGGSKSILFIGEYMNRKGCYDKDGNSDIVKAVLEEVKERVFIKYNSTDPATIAQRIAEHPMSIQEAVMRRDGTLFPVADLTDHLNYIESNKIEWNRGHLVGELYQDPNGIVQFRPTDEEPIRDFPLKDNRHKGALEIYELPKEVNGKVPSYRYIGGIDPVDDDHSTTVSLPSIFILDMFTDRIVAEYTGRPNFADDFYEICRKLALFYNASLNYENDKKGLFTYFSNHHCTYMLCDTPDILRDIELVKSSLYGNKAHPYDQLVYTPKGLQRWEEIKVGDYLFDTQGGVTKVLEIPFDNETEIYKITLQDGRTIEASSNHLWKVIDYNGLEKIKTTSELKSKYLRQKGKYQESLYYIPSNKGIEYKEKEVKIDPYFLGLLLGDGTLGSATRNKVSFTSAIQDIKEYSSILNFKYKTFDDRHHSIECSNIKSYLQELDLYDKRSHTKFIPDLYKYNSKKVRLELLKGLMDTDGTCEDNGNSSYTTVSERLAQDVLFLVRSLGINCNLNVNSNSYGLVYNIRIYTDIPIFKLSRKYSKQKITKNRAFKTGIRKIEYIGKKRAKCVTVDSQDHCYLIGDFVVTHNSKGTNSGKQVNAYARRLIRDWLLQPIKTKQIVKDENGNEIEKEVTIKNLQRIRGTALLKELITWNPDINADRVSALGMLMILRENNMKYLPGEGQFEGKRPRKNYLGNDPFFSKNYGI
jgi:intein/homing endonuclease|nr:MAG TPA: Terminase large subunit [Crassvirales sp.]